MTLTALCRLFDGSLPLAKGNRFETCLCKTVPMLEIVIRGAGACLLRIIVLAYSGGSCASRARVSYKEAGHE